MKIVHEVRDLRSGFSHRLVVDGHAGEWTTYVGLATVVVDNFTWFVATEAFLGVFTPDHVYRAHSVNDLSWADVSTSVITDESLLLEETIRAEAHPQHPANCQAKSRDLQCVKPFNHSGPHRGLVSAKNWREW